MKKILLGVLGVGATSIITAGAAKIVKERRVMTNSEIYTNIQAVLQKIEENTTNCKNSAVLMNASLLLDFMNSMLNSKKGYKILSVYYSEYGLMKDLNVYNELMISINNVPEGTLDTIILINITNLYISICEKVSEIDRVLNGEEK